MSVAISRSESSLYLAYGSNLHPLRLQTRLPTSHFIAVTTIAGFQINFNKRGRDGSGKCNLTPAGEQVSSYGALYSIGRSDSAELDRIESGYSRYHLNIELTNAEADGASQIHPAFTYLANPESIDHSLQPYGWYHALVMAGARFLNFAPDYLQQLQQVARQHDPHPERSAQQNQLLLQIKDHCDKTARTGDINCRITRWEPLDTEPSPLGGRSVLYN